MKLRHIFTSLAAVGLIVGFVLAASHPPDALQREFVRIIHVHVPASWVAFLAFGVTMLAGLMWLITKRDTLDHVAAASAELGVFFTALSLLSGMIWGQATWGVAWDWGDPRMASTALMFFVYVGYLALRRSIADPVVRAKRSSILGLVAFLQVPLVYFSVNLWRGLHQTQSVRPDGWTIENNDTIFAMLANLAAYTLVYATFTAWRTRQLAQESLLAEKEAADLGPAGNAIEAPTLGKTT